MRAPLLKATFVAVLAIAWPATAQESRQVIEAAYLVHYDTAARVLVVTTCQSCPKVQLKVTDDSYVRVDGQHRPFSTEGLQNRPFDTVYALKDNRVLWLQPIPVVDR